MGYRQFEVQTAPTAAQGPYGQAFMRALGLVKDAYFFQAQQSVMARFPDYAPPDALGSIGHERKIDQGNDIQLSSPETDSAYAQRLINSWQTWALGGTAWGMLQAFAAQGYFPELVCANGLIYSVNNSLVLSITQGPPLTFQIPFWNTFMVFFSSAPSSWTSISSPPTTSSTPSIYELRKLRDDIINRWKPAWALCIGIAVLTSGSPGIWGAPGYTYGEAGATWGSSFTWFAPMDFLQWGLPPDDSGGDYQYGSSALTWGDTAV